MKSNRINVEQNNANDINGDERLEDDGSALHSVEGDSEDSSGCRSSSESDVSNDERGESEDDSNDDHPREEEDEADHRAELCEVSDSNPGEDAETQPSARHRAIILILSALLMMLLLNFGYQLSRIFQASRPDSPKPKNDAEVVNRNIGMDPKAESRNRRKAKVVGNDANVAGGENSNDDGSYRMPKHPSRIYTHASLGGNRYRAGGVLSDEMLRGYEEDGVLVIRNLISPKLLDRLDEASRMLIDGRDEASKKTRRGRQFHMVKNGAVFLGVPPPKDGTICDTTAIGDETCEARAERGGSDDDDALSSFRDLAMYSKIPLVAASLLRLDELRAGGEQYLNLSRKQKLQQREGEEDASRVDDSINLRICRDIFLTKDDDPYACGWHTDDAGFWPSVASDPGVNAWVALDDMPWPWSGKVPPGSEPSGDGSSRDGPSGPVATFALSLGSHRAPWRHEAYEVTGSTHTNPPEGYRSAADLVQRRSGSGTCNIQTSAPHLYEKLEENKVIYDLKRGDVIFHDRWVFHRTVTTSEYSKMAHGSAAQRKGGGGGESRSTTPPGDKIFRRYSIRYAPGTARVPPGYGVELSVLHDEDNANRTLDEIVDGSGLPWYPKVWPHALKRKPLHSPGKLAGDESEEEETDGLSDLVHDHMPRAEGLQKERKKEIQRLVSMRGGQ